MLGNSNFLMMWLFLLYVSKLLWERNNSLVNIQMAKKNKHSPDFANGNRSQHQQTLFLCLHAELVK